MSYTAHIRLDYGWLGLPQMMLTQGRICDIQNNLVVVGSCLDQLETRRLQ